MRGIGITFLLLALWYIAYGFLVPALAPAIPPRRLFIRGCVLLFFSICLLRRALIREFLHPSRYDIYLATIAVLLWSYILSWVYTPSFWGRVLHLCYYLHLNKATTRSLFGIGFFFSFALASCLCLFHVTVLVAPPLRLRFRPLLLGHTAAFFLLLLSIGIGSRIANHPFPYFSISHHS